MSRSATDIQADLDAAYASRRIALQAQEYALNDGQGSQAVKRASLSQINETIRELQNELDNAVADAGGDTGLMSASLDRYGS